MLHWTLTQTRFWRCWNAMRHEAKSSSSPHSGPTEKTNLWEFSQPVYFFDGTHEITVNTKIRVRDQELGPIAADLKRVMRGKSRVGVPTFA